MRMIVCLRLKGFDSRTCSAVSIKLGRAVRKHGTAWIELVDDNLPVLAGQHATLLSASSRALLAKIAFGALLRLFPAWHLGQVHIQDQPAQAIAVRSGLTVLTEKRRQSTLHLLDILSSSRIQGLLRHRLFTTAFSTETLLESRI